MKNRTLLLALFVTALAGCSKDNNEPADPGSTPPPAGGDPHVVLEKKIGATNADEYGNGICQTADGGFLIVGDSLRKTDANGMVQFTKAIDGNSVRPTSDGNYIIAGIYSGAIYKVDPSGTIIWTKNITGSLNFIRETSDGSFIGTGNVTVKTDASGNVTWSKLLGTTGLNDNFEAYDVDQTADGGYVIAGTQVTGSTWDAQLKVYKLDASGNISWVREFGNPSYTDEGYSVVATADGGCVAAGMINTGWFDMWLMKLDAAGNQTWSKTYGKPTTSEAAARVRATQDGGYVLVGSTDVDGNGNTLNAYVVKVDGSGTLQWQAEIGGSMEDYFSAVWPMSNGNYAVTGAGDYNNSTYKGNVYLMILKD